MQLNFDATRVAPSTAPEPVETGTYPVIIKAAQEKPTRANDGSTLLELIYEVMNGPAAGKRITDRLNLGNKNPQAVEIAYGQLSAICHVTNRLRIQSEQQLLGGTMQVYVVKEPRADAPGQYGNSVKGYKDMQGNDPGQGGQHGNMQQGGGAPQGQNFGGGQPQGQGFDPNANQGGGGYGQPQNNNGFDPNSQGGGYGNPNGGGNFGGGQPQNNGGGYNPNQGGGGFDPNANGQGGGYNPNQNQGGGYQQQPNNQGGGYNPNQGGGAGGPAGNGNAPSWA